MVLVFVGFFVFFFLHQMFIELPLRPRHGAGHQGYTDKQNTASAVKEVETQQERQACKQIRV